MPKQTESEWRELIAEQEQSGLTQREWCKTKGINIHTFRNRKQTVTHIKAIQHPEQRGEKTPKPIQWLSPTPTPTAKGGRIEIRVDRFTVTAEPDFDEPTFIQVCRALMSLC